MTNAEQRLVDFSSGMKKLGDDSRNYIHKLTQVLFLVERPPIYPALKKKFPELGDKPLANGEE